MLRNTRRYFRTADGRYPIFAYALVIFFWTLADATGQYIAPLLMQAHGFSYTMIGFILGTSSITGAAFDFLVSLVFKNTNFRRLLMIMFALCLIYPLTLWAANSLWLFLLAMAVWGIYFDLYNISTFDFVSRYTTRSANASGFGTVQVFRSLGLIVAPLVIGFIVVETVDWRAFSLYWLYIAIAIGIFAFLLYLVRGMHPHEAHEHKRRNVFAELRLWKKVGGSLFPMLVLVCHLYMVEAFFWTLAPLYAQTVEMGGFGGLFLMAYSLPVLVVGWIVGSFTKRFGKRRTAFISLLIGSVILSTFALVPQGVSVIALVLTATFFTSMSLPAISATFADYILDHNALEGEAEALEDLAANVGYIVGPMGAGLLADLAGMPGTFSLLGVFGAGLAMLLLLTTSRARIAR